MSAFGGMVLTNRGRNLQAKAQAGAQLNFTRFGVGDGELGTSSIVELNALKNQVKSINITKLKSATEGKAAVGMVLSNQDLVTGFYFREVGLFAQDPDVGEILYCYANAGATADYIPAGGGTDIIEKSFDVIAIVGTAANVTATINSSLIYASSQDLTDHQNLNASETEKGHIQLATIAEATTGTDVTKAVTAAGVKAVINAVINAAPGALDTLDELAQALGDDPNFATTITSLIGTKANQSDLTTHLADDVNHVNYAVTTGVANNYAVTLNPAPAALTEGFSIAVKINVDSTAASTLNVNLLGAKSIKKANGNDVTNLKAGGIYTLRYDGINFILQGEGGEYGTALPGDVRITKTLGTENNGIVPGTLDLSLLIPNNLRKNITVDGITGDKLEFGAGDSINYSRPFNTNSQIASAVLPNTSVVGTRRFIDGGFYQIFSLSSSIVLRRYNPDLNTIEYDVSLATTTYSLLAWDMVKASDGFHYISYVLSNSGYFYHKMTKINPSTGAKIWTIDLVGGFTTYTTQQICTSGNYIYAPSLTGNKLQRIDFNGVVTDLVTGLSSMAFVATDDTYLAISDGSNIYTYNMEGRNLSGGTAYIAMYSRGTYESFGPLKCKAGFLFTITRTGSSNELVSINRKRLPDLVQLGGGGPFVLNSADMNNFYIDDAITLVADDLSIFYIGMIRTCGYATDNEMQNLSMANKIYRSSPISELVKFDAANGDIYRIEISGTNTVTRYHIDAKFR